MTVSTLSTAEAMRTSRIRRRSCQTRSATQPILNCASSRPADRRARISTASPFHTADNIVSVDRNRRIVRAKPGMPQQHHIALPVGGHQHDGAAVFQQQNDRARSHPAPQAASTATGRPWPTSRCHAASPTEQPAMAFPQPGREDRCDPVRRRESGPPRRSPSAGCEWRARRPGRECPSAPVPRGCRCPLPCFPDCRSPVAASAWSVPRDGEPGSDRWHKSRRTRIFRQSK